MEALRLAANDFFKVGNFPAAQEKYHAAASLLRTHLPPHTDASRYPLLLEEWTKCISNLCTTLHKQKQYDACMEMAQWGIDVNPLISKCHAFLGICLLDKAKELGETEGAAARSDEAVWVEDAHRHLCRAVYILPAAKVQLAPYLTEVVQAIRRVDNAAAAAASTTACEVRVGACGSHGNGVFAVTPIPKGVAFASTTSPFSAVAYAEFNGQGICAQCSIANQSSSNDDNDDQLNNSCPSCKHVWYCSNRCKVFAQDRHARFECKPFSMLREMAARIEERNVDVPDDYQDMLAHLITTRAAYLMAKEAAEQEEEQQAAERSDVKREGPNRKLVTRLFSLESHAAEVTQSLVPIASLAQDLFPNDSVSLLATLIGIVRCNALEIRDSTGLGVGQALHVEGVTSYFNHSCEPNCALDHNNGTIVTIRSVAAGEPLHISYIPQLYWPRLLRQEGLAERYFFTCRCTRCASTTDAMERILTRTLPNARERATEYFHTVVQNLCGAIRGRQISDLAPSDIPELEALQLQCLKELYPTHYLFQDLRNTLTFEHSALGNTKAALRTSLGEMLLWESLIRGHLPVKINKLVNSVMCRAELRAEGANVGEEQGTESHMWGMLDAYAALYGISIPE